MTACPLRRSLDQGATDSSTGMVGVDADLLDVPGTVDDVEQQIPDGSLVGVSGHKGTAVLSVRRKICNGTRIVVCDEIHAEDSKGLACSRLYRNERGEILAMCGSDRHSLRHVARLLR